MLKELTEKTMYPIPPWAVFEGEDGGDGGGGGEPAGEPTGEPAGEPPSEPIISSKVSPVKPDGTFIDGWRDMLPDELKAEKCLDTVTDFNNAIKQLVNHKKMVGKDKVTLPTDKSTDEEWGEFYGKIGRPETAGDYKVDVPEDLGDIFTKERVDQAKEIAFKIGASQKQFQMYMAEEMAQAEALAKQQEEYELQMRNKAEDLLRREFGAAYDERIHITNRLITEALPNEEERMNFVEEFGNNPRFIKFASTIGARMTESKALVAELTQKTPNEAMARIKELQNTPGYSSLTGEMSQERRDQITAEIRSLYKQVYPAKAV